MIINNLLNLFRKIIKDHRKNKILYLRAIVHLVRYCLFSSYRKKKCLVDPASDFFYKYGNLANYFETILLIFARYLKKKNIFISINNDCNDSIGHIYAEIDQIHRMQKLDDKYSGSKIWFTTSKKEILGETKNIFENKNFKVLFGGIKRAFLLFVAIKCPSISINGSVGHKNYILGKDNSDNFVFYSITKQRARLIRDSQYFFPNKDKLINYQEEKYQLMQRLNISKNYVVIQIKTVTTNGTIEPLRPHLLLKSIKYLQDKDYQIVFAGREKFPEIFLNKSIIDYANSQYASPLNDFLIVGNCSLVLSSGSGFSALPESLDKPLLIINAHHICQYPGPRTIYVPTLLSRRSKPFNASIQQEYLFTYGRRCGYFIFDDMYIFHRPTSEEIFMATKELEEMLSNFAPSYTPLQEKIHKHSGIPLLSDVSSKISHYYLKKHKSFFY